MYGNSLSFKPLKPQGYCCGEHFPIPELNGTQEQCDEFWRTVFKSMSARDRAINLAINGLTEDFLNSDSQEKPGTLSQQQSFNTAMAMSGYGSYMK